MLNMRKKEKKFSLGSSVPHTFVKFNHVSRMFLFIFIF